MINANVAAKRHENASSILPLPLNLIALIISYLDRSSDLARICRTCRVFHYMTLPQLYSDVSLRSYDYIRYCPRDGRPQGCGMASPFSMGLNGLVTRNVAGYVKNFGVHGEWKEHEPQEHAKVGRVPDESMMLNTLVRVAIEKMAVLDSFSWQLNTKMLPTIWQGLAQNGTLTKLTVKFPSSRYPRPITLVPPIPSLEYLHIFDIDPLCYADDVSLLFLGSKKLRDLKLHFCPRMREAREPSIHKSAYFGRCRGAQYAIPLKSLAIQNLYSHNDDDCGESVEFAKLQELTFLNSIGGIDDMGATAFMDGTWRKADGVLPTQLKSLRIDKVSRQLCEFVSSTNNLEKIYLIGPQSHTHCGSRSQSQGDTPLPRSPPSSISSPNGGDNNSVTALKTDYIEAITKQHGHSLKHLLLLPQWRLTNDEFALIARRCPNLEQLGIGVEFASFAHLRLLVPFLSNLTTFRILSNPDDPSFVNKMRELDETGLHEDKIGEETVNRDWSRMKYIELGADDMIFEIGPRELMEQQEENGLRWKTYTSGDGKEGKTSWRRRVKKATWDAVKHIDIWKMDSLDL